MTLSADDFPVGIEDFKKLITSGRVYVDKTEELERLIKSGSDVTLLLRPRRFGKTLSMSMLQNFLELNYADPEDRSGHVKLFKKLFVYKKKKKLCREHMGRHPVISISLKDVDGDDFEDAMRVMKIILHKFFQKYRFLLESDKQYEDTKKSLRKKIEICSNDELNLSNAEEMSKLKGIAKDSLAFISGMLYDEYGLKSIIIVDEYDVPLQKAKAKSKKKTNPDEEDYYDKMLGVIRGMLGLALKTNSFMKKGFVTGCLRIAHQSVFTGINNFSCYEVKDAPYSKFIGFTREETVNLLKECGMENRLEDVLTWYDGYNIGGSEMLCPWSVLNFLSRALAPENNPDTFQPENYWANTSGNDIVEMCMKRPDATVSQRLQNLIDGNTEEIELKEFETYPDIRREGNFNTLATLLMHTGYFTYVGDAVSAKTGKTTIRIPNEEVRKCFEDRAKHLFSDDNSEWKDKVLSLRDALFDANAAGVQHIINDMLTNFISVRDTSYESFYHGFMTGALSIATSNEMQMTSNQESGHGYSDLILTRETDKSAAILEFKRTKDESFAAREKLCDEAIKQINRNEYDSSLKQYGCVRILKYGIAFCGKSCTVKLAMD